MLDEGGEKDQNDNYLSEREVSVCLTLITSHRAKVKIYTRTQWETGTIMWSSSVQGKLANSLCSMSENWEWKNQSRLSVKLIIYEGVNVSMLQVSQQCSFDCMCITGWPASYREVNRYWFTSLSSPAHSSRGSGWLGEAHGCTAPPQDHCKMCWSPSGWIWTP